MADAGECDTQLLDVIDTDSCCAAVEVTDGVTIEVSTDKPVPTGLGAATVLPRIMTEADAVAATATFNVLEWNFFFQDFRRTSDRFVSISKVLNHRDTSPGEDDDEEDDDEEDDDDDD